VGVVITFEVIDTFTSATIAVGEYFEETLSPTSNIVSAKVTIEFGLNESTRLVESAQKQVVVAAGSSLSTNSTSQEK
jgi:hypothetical protein